MNKSYEDHFEMQKYILLHQDILFHSIGTQLF